MTLGPGAFDGVAVAATVSQCIINFVSRQDAGSNGDVHANDEYGRTRKLTRNAVSQWPK